MGSTDVFAGIDVGSTTAKVSLVQGGTCVASALIPTGHDMAQASEMVLGQALEKGKFKKEDLTYTVATGYGRHGVSFADEALSEIACHGKGAFKTIPETRVVVDIGGQDSKLIWLSDTGSVIDFAMNDKCAAGTGRFLDLVSETLGVKLEELGVISLDSHDPCIITSTCAIFAESEVVGLRSRGTGREDIIAGIHQSLALRITSMGSRRGFKKEVVFSGGVAKNIGMQRALEQRIGFSILLPDEPQLLGSLGAALIASER